MMNIRTKAILLHAALTISATAASAAPQAPAPYPKSASTRFFGVNTGNMFYRGSLTAQFEESMSGGVEQATRLPNDSSFIATCRPRSCTEKTAAVVSAGNALIGAGFVSWQCAATARTCQTEPAAFIYVKRGAQYDFARTELIKWARTTLDKSESDYGTPAKTKKVNVIFVP